MGLFDRLFKKNQTEKTDAEVLNKELNEGLSKTRHGFMEKVFGVLSGKEIDDDLYDELEEALIQGDVGVNTALDLVERLREREKRDHLKTSEDLKEAFADEMVQLLGEEEQPLTLVPDTLNIILFVGVNGVGKTTSIGKIAYQLKEQGHKVILGAADTFRAAAADQLKIWGERVGCDVIAHQEGADPAAVVFDAIAAAKSRGCDVLLVDTAGRLQNKVNLMNELAKIFNAMGIDTNDVIEAAASKWNFIKLKPGLVGGHCISVDPYYLIQKAQVYGVLPRVMSAARRLNDGMGDYVANQVIKLMNKKGILVKNSNILLLGITFKENCPDIRNTKIVDIYHTLKEYTGNITVYDPWANSEAVKHEYDIDVSNELNSKEKYDAVILGVAHKEFLALNVRSLVKEIGIVYDVKGILPKEFVDGRL